MFEAVDDRDYYAYREEGFGVVPIAIYLMAGSALAAGSMVTSWLSKNEWSVGEYNTYMRIMYDTILSWDKIGWSQGCWAKNPTRRELWANFMQQFGLHYRQGVIPDYSYVSDAEEKPARLFMQRMAEWGDWLNTHCNAGTNNPFGPTGAPEPGSTEENASSLETMLKLGIYLTAGVVAVNLLKGLKDLRS